MSNPCDTTYKVTGTRKAVENLRDAFVLTALGSSIDIPLCKLADHYGIKYEGKDGVSVRGHIYYFDYDYDEENDTALLSFDTETDWSSCDELFKQVNKALGNELSISWRAVEPGCGIFFTHDEGNYFTEECYVTAIGDTFGEDCEDFYDTVGDAIKVWCEKTGISQGDRSDEEMTEFINSYEYDDDDTCFNINTIQFG